MVDPSNSAARPPAMLRLKVRKFVLSEHLVLWLSILYVTLLGPSVPGFFSTENAVNILLALLPLFLAALGQTFVLITGGIDLSVTSVIGLTSVVGAKVMTAQHGWLGNSPWATPLAVLVMLLLGTGIGGLNGLAITRLRLPAFIVTFTGMMFFGGLAIWVTQSRNIGALPDSFNRLGGNAWLACAIAVVIGGFAHLMLARSLFGRWLFATGHNARAADISGVPVPATIIAAYAVSGFCAALASILYTGQTETGSPVLAQRVLLDVIGATIIGGTSLFGGKGKVAWTLCGVLFLKLVDNTLNLLNLSVFAITMVKGGVILFAALLDATRHRFSGARA
jgi:ribose/xylose/arabinose/galactoside ABC-type transport system permease subunit